MYRRIVQALLILVLVLSASNVLADEPLAPLSRNPFEKPALLQPKNQSTPGAEVSTRRAPAQPSFELRATIVDGQDSFANIDGRIISLGDAIDGYVLKEVHHEEIVMEKSKTRFTIPLGGGR